MDRAGPVGRVERARRPGIDRALLDSTLVKLADDPARVELLQHVTASSDLTAAAKPSTQADLDAATAALFDATPPGC